MRRGRIITLTGSTASGKTEITRKLLQQLGKAHLIQSITTRAPCDTDLPGEYRYITKEEFDHLGRGKENALLWRTEHKGTWYATTWDDVSKALEPNVGSVSIMILVPNVMDRLLRFVRRVTGEVHQEKTTQLLSFFVRSPDIETLRDRVRRRGQDPVVFEERWRAERDWEAQLKAIPLLGYTPINNPEGNIQSAVDQILDRLYKPY